MGQWNFFNSIDPNPTGPKDPFTGFIPGMTGSPTGQPPQQPNPPQQTFGEPSPIGGNTEPSFGSFSLPQQNTGLFKFGGESSFKPIQSVSGQQGPRYRINEAMMRSPYYNPYFSSFQ